MRAFALLLFGGACGSVVAERNDAAVGDDAPIDAEVDAPIDARIPLGAFVLATTPDPSIVFNTIAETYEFSNNLVNTIWHRQTNKLITGDFSQTNYWSFAPATTAFSTTPDQTGTTIHGRLTHVAATNRVLYSTQAGAFNNPAPAATFMVATVDANGLLTGDQAAVYSDGFAGNCQLTSSSATEWFCFDGTAIRRYLTAAGSATLTANGMIPFSVALPAGARCDAGQGCFGGTFAFDGAFFYFSAATGNSVNLMYVVYNTTGTFVNTFTALGNGAINGIYFDWSIGRYSTHDGFAGRTGGSVFTVAAPNTGSDDTQSFSTVSANHVLDD